MSLARASVDRIVRAYKDEKRSADTARPGRPSSTSADEDPAIVAVVNLEPSLSLTEIGRNVFLKMSLCTIGRRLVDAASRSRIVCQRPRLSHPENKEARLVFAENQLSWKEAEWSQVVFRG
ncbi:hypothetical protein HPB48_018716 [Haemaphysalis longicornis]|uniref:Transposase Tc1-like domain-containing protein n=1 Tax=Haemaphysalis longicornis TaxID=44386 RepID=A0A9J6G2A6_HAELO|nr:hypothetical protein HPB48_018716 [Haemaphysalis longicornis]